MAASTLSNPLILGMLGRVRKLDLRNVTAYGCRVIILQRLLHAYVVERSSEAVCSTNRLFSRVLGPFTSLLELYISFRAVVTPPEFELIPGPSGLVRRRLVHMEDYFVGFGIQSILAME
jgi:hypothetical protein